MIEGSGSVPVTNGSGYRRPTNIRILWIQIRIWIPLEEMPMNAAKYIGLNQLKLKYK